MIIKYADIRAVRPIAENMVDEKRLSPYLDECESLYLKPAIGVALYHELAEYLKTQLITEENPTAGAANALFDLLMTGGLYNNNTKDFAGLKKAMGYLVYSRFIRNQNVNITAFGVVQKQGQYSDPVDERTIVRTSNEAEKIGLQYLSQSVDYLKEAGKLEKEKKVKINRKFKAIGD